MRKLLHIGNTYASNLHSMILLLKEKQLYEFLDDVFSRNVKQLLTINKSSGNKNLVRKMQEVNFSNIMPIGYINEMSSLLGEIGEDKKAIEEASTNIHSETLIQEIINQFCKEVACKDAVLIDLSESDNSINNEINNLDNQDIDTDSIDDLIEDLLEDII